MNRTGPLILLLSLLFLPGLVTAGSITVGTGNGTTSSTILLPVFLTGGEIMNRLDLTIAYDQDLFKVVDVLPGDFTANTTLEKTLGRGEVQITMASPEGISGDGILAWIRFEVIAPSGSSAVQILSARSSVILQRVDGTLTIIPGISFATVKGGKQLVTVDSKVPVAVISGTNISFSRDGMHFLIETEGLGTTGTRSTGVVRTVTVTGPIASANLSLGKMEGSCELTLSQYPSEGVLSLALSDQIPPDLQNALTQTAAKSSLTLISIPFVATPAVHGISSPGPIFFSFSIPPSLTLVGNETFRIASRERNGPMTLFSPIQENRTGTLVLRATLARVPEELALLIVQESAHPVSTPAATSQAGSLLEPGTEAASGSIWTGMILMFFLIAIVVVSVFYVHRRRGG